MTARAHLTKTPTNEIFNLCQNCGFTYHLAAAKVIEVNIACDFLTLNSIIMKKRVVADYEAKTKYELTIKAGQIVDKLSEISDNGWCIVQFADSSGWVPAGYLEETEATVFLSMMISPYPLTIILTKGICNCTVWIQRTERISIVN